MRAAGTLGVASLGVGAVGAQSTDAPAAPTGLSISPLVGSTARVEWDVTAAPCTTSIDHYVVSIDGDDRATVPPGIGFAQVEFDGSNVTAGVRAVSPEGTASPETTVQRRVPSVDPTTFLDVTTASDTVDTGESVEVTVAATQGYGIVPPDVTGDVTVAVGAPCAATITGGDAAGPASLTGSVSVASDGSSITIPIEATGIDSSTESVDLATVTLTGQSAGHTRVQAASPVLASERWTTVTVEAGDGPPAIVDGSPPTDPNDDGVYEDLNGNGEFDSDDVVTYFQHIDDATIQNHPSSFDANGNGNVDFDDVVTLFQAL